MVIFEIITKIMVSTPIWVWLILLVLIVRGISLKRGGAISLKRSCLVPIVFIAWGLERVFWGFHYPIESLVFYLVLLLVGTMVGLQLYAATQKYYLKSGKLMRVGSGVPLVIILSNFIVKYGLNILMAVNPALLGNEPFNLVYSIISGFTAGLFVGGIMNTINCKKKLEQENGMA